MITVIPAAPPVPGVAADNPVATPLDGSIYATPGSPTLQIPPLVALLMFVVRPSHTCGKPVITAGSGFTVRITCALQPVPSAYVIVDVPATLPVATPVLASITAVAVSLLAHVPPGVVLPSVVVRPSHT